MTNDQQGYQQGYQQTQNQQQASQLLDQSGVPGVVQPNQAEQNKIDEAVQSGQGFGQEDQNHNMRVTGAASATLSVAPLTYEATQRVQRVVAAIIDAGATGFTFGTMFALMGPVMKELPPVFQYMDAIKEEFNTMKLSAIHGVYAGLDPLMARWIK